jgi:phospholipid/cholesterol/gamma-HCH transport system permease protein
VAVLTLGSRIVERAGKTFELRYLTDHHRAALELMPRGAERRELPEPEPGFLERVGDRMLVIRDRARQLGTLLGEVARESVAVITRHRKLPEGDVTHHAVTIGADALFIVGLLSFLIGMTMAFQGVVQLRKFGADVYVADLISLSMVREFAPMMTAIILAGRAGAAIAAELGTMRVGAEIDALRTMGINPVRFLVLPRLVALTLTVPALTLLSIFIGIAGGMAVASGAMEMPPAVFWNRTVEMVTLGDFAHGVGKSLVFAWIIGITGTFFGLNTPPNAGAVGTATTRTVVVCIFCIVCVDGAFATISTLRELA